MELNDIRKLFPHINSGKVYFNHASIGPLPNNVKDAIANYTAQRNLEPIGNYAEFVETEKRAKSKLARLIGSEFGKVAWTNNVANAMSFLVTGLKWNKNDHILIHDIEFPSNAYPFLNLRNEGVNVEVIKTKEGRIDFEELKSKITKQTKLISVSFVQFWSGYKIDLNEFGKFCTEHDILFCVDGIQGVGTFPVDAIKNNIDFLAGSSQKWLLSLQGCAFFHISDKLHAMIKPRAMGWYSVKSDWELLNYDMELKDDATRYETGTRNALGITAFEKSLDIFLDTGIEKVGEYILQNTKYLMSLLKETGIVPLLDGVADKNLSGIVTFRYDKPDELKKFLGKRDIIVEVREGCIRVSPHFYNTKSEINKLMEGVRDFNS